MARPPIVLIHGYSSSGTAFDAWKRVLLEHGYAEKDIHVLTCMSLTNEVTIDDIAEGFDRALETQVGLDNGEGFDAIVHSTGMLVIRSWLTKFATNRRRRLRHLIALAPATFGSPLAHKGRGYLGAVAKGNRTKGPDFREAGDLVLDGLELGSRFTWELAHRDLLCNEPRYDETSQTPYVFTFCGTEKYEGLAEFVSEPGTDGAVRLAGCPLNTRKILLDLTRPRDESTEGRADVAEWSNADIPLVPVRDLNHGTIMSDPSDALVALVVEALDVEDAAAFESWLTHAKGYTDSVLAAEEKLGRWQQLVFRVLDDRGDPVRDYVIAFVVKDQDGTWKPLTEVFQSLEMSVHTYARDPSLRCFHINLEHADILEREIGLRLIASSGTSTATRTFGSFIPSPPPWWRSASTANPCRSGASTTCPSSPTRPSDAPTRRRWSSPPLCVNGNGTKRGSKNSRSNFNRRHAAPFVTDLTPVASASRNALVERPMDRTSTTTLLVRRSQPLAFHPWEPGPTPF